MMKKIFDFVISFLLLVFFSLLMVILTAYVKIDSRGPVLYKGLRIGRNGKPFKIMKFRTMVVNAEKLGGPSTAGDDSRITSAGKLLRKYKLDELPQLFNVILGDMSFVGPRPEVKEYVDLYTEDEKKILELKPGITDYASIEYNNEGEILKGHSDPEKAYLELIRPGKIKLQLKYYKDRSLKTDVRILFQTFKMLVTTRT